MFNNTHRKQKSAPVADPIEFALNGQPNIHQVTIIGDAPLTTGTIPVFVKTNQDAEYEPLQKDGADYELVIVAGGVRSFSIPLGSISSILLGNIDPEFGVVAAPVNGTNWKVKVISGMNG